MNEKIMSIVATLGATIILAIGFTCIPFAVLGDDTEY